MNDKVKNDERLRVLQLVNDGKITVEDAERLLDALDPPVPHPTAPTPVIPEKAKRKRSSPPDMRRFRRYWQYPFLVGVIMLGVAGLCASNTSLLLLQLCGWSVFALAALITVVGWVSQWSPWIHVRVQERKGRRFAVSLPLPLSLIGWHLKLTKPLIRRYANEDAARYLDMATALLSTMDSGLLVDQPITIDVDEPDGDLVQVFIG
jgi:hypothetical protein